MKVNLPSQLPMLPGNSYDDPTVTRYHKSQLLNYKDGSCQETNTLAMPEVNTDILNATSSLQYPQRPTAENEAIPKESPQWLKHDR